MKASGGSMGRIPRDVVDAVRDRTDIIEVIARHVVPKQFDQEHRDVTTSVGSNHVILQRGSP